MIVRDKLSIRNDFVIIGSLVAEGARVLDVGCGDGVLLDFLKREKKTFGKGIEIDQAKVNLCVTKGLSVIQGDADSDLDVFPDKVFDYVILSQTLQATRAPRDVLKELLRIGDKVIVSIPNFAYWYYRFQLLFGGRMPEGGCLPYEWYNTPNIHLCTIKDFYELAASVGADIVRVFPLGDKRQSIAVPAMRGAMNLLANEGLFVLERKAVKGL